MCARSEQNTVSFGGICAELCSVSPPSSFFSMLLLTLFFNTAKRKRRGRGKNKEWHLFLLAYPKTAFVSVTMVWGYWCRRGCEAVARTPGLHSVVGIGNWPTFFLQTAAIIRNGFWFSGFKVQTAYWALANVYLCVSVQWRPLVAVVAVSSVCWLMVVV